MDRNKKKEQYSKFVAAAEIRLQNHLKADFFLAPESFDEHETNWFNANVK